MSQLHRKPPVELISPIASQNEIQIGNRPKFHALLVFLAKLDKIKRKENFFQTPENWSQEKKGCIPAYSPWDSSSSASSSLSLRGSWSLKENFPERSRLQKAFFAENLLPRAPGEKEPWKQVVIGFPRLLFSQQTKVATHTTAKSNKGNLNPNELFYCQYWFQLQINQNIFFSQ